ncbi:MAG: hypothetical protein ACLRRJ_07335 [Clostridium sp.]
MDFDTVDVTNLNRQRCI